VTSSTIGCTCSMKGLDSRNWTRPGRWLVSDLSCYCDRPNIVIQFNWIIKRET
jgi:hypothetical protein